MLKKTFVRTVYDINNAREEIKNVPQDLGEHLVLELIKELGMQAHILSDEYNQFIGVDVYQPSNEE